jgi:EAL domain-containing protein (putative c-di-GMP-specific phosphodiesterase class I)/uncharacterized protein YeeX (DUF496 family)
MIENIMKNGSLKIHFQPILSVKSSKIIGVEALMRAYDENGEFLSPVFVFEQAKKEGLSFEFDKFVRGKALESFAKIYSQHKDIFLFLNFESHLLNEKIDFEAFDFCSIASDLKIPSRNIVLEIKENQITNTKNLEKFSEYFKALGFLIALDDFGSGNANFDRISLVRPHIVKIDRSLIYNIHENFINKEILKSIANMCFNIGALVLAEGVEKEEEIFRTLKLDIDIFQGFWFAKPKEEVFNQKLLEEKLMHVGFKHTQNVKSSIRQKEKLIQEAREYTKSIIQNIKQTDINSNLTGFLKKNLNVEAIYIIEGATGVQKGDTYILKDTNEFFTPAQNGDNHAMKEYFYITKESKRGSFLSQRYISRASGKMCRTFAQRFSYGESEYIICIDLLQTHNLNN